MMVFVESMLYIDVAACVSRVLMILQRRVLESPLLAASTRTSFRNKRLTVKIARSLLLLRMLRKAAWMVCHAAEDSRFSTRPPLGSFTPLILMKKPDPC